VRKEGEKIQWTTYFVNDGAGYWRMFPQKLIGPYFRTLSEKGASTVEPRTQLREAQSAATGVELACETLAKEGHGLRTHIVSAARTSS